MERAQLLLMVVLFPAAIIWLLLVARLFHVLKNDHPAMYESLGSPRGFEARTTEALFRFLLSRKPESLSNNKILLLANVMRTMLPIYVTGFAVLFALIMQSQPS